MSQEQNKTVQSNRTDYALGKENKRRYARLDIALSVSYALKTPGGEVSELAEAMSSDISAGGLRLMTPGPLQPGDLLDLEISICGSEDSPIRAHGEVVWQNKIGDTSYETGTVIKYVNDNDKQRFMNFVFEQMSRLMGVSANPMVH